MAERWHTKEKISNSYWKLKVTQNKLLPTWYVSVISYNRMWLASLVPLRDPVPKNTKRQNRLTQCKKRLNFSNLVNSRKQRTTQSLNPCRFSCSSWTRRRCASRARLLVRNDLKLLSGVPKYWEWPKIELKLWNIYLKNWPKLSICDLKYISGARHIDFVSRGFNSAFWDVFLVIFVWSKPGDQSILPKLSSFHRMHETLPIQQQFDQNYQ